MKIMAFECSATAASVCIFEDDKVLGQVYSNVPLTHSQTLMPMAENLLSATRLSFADIEQFAISSGPGSFTGIRIGIAAVKGLAAAKNTPCIAVSTLEAMAELIDSDGIICAVMDARCSQVYNALFERKNGVLKRLCEDRALLIDELLPQLPKDKKIILVGDGATMLYSKLSADNVYLAPPHLRYQNAVGVCLAARNKQAINCDELLPFYLRLPQAERELKRKEGKK